MDMFDVQLRWSSQRIGASSLFQLAEYRLLQGNVESDGTPPGLAGLPTPARHLHLISLTRHIDIKRLVEEVLELESILLQDPLAFGADACQVVLPSLWAVIWSECSVCVNRPHPILDVISHMMERIRQQTRQLGRDVSPIAGIRSLAPDGLSWIDSAVQLAYTRSVLADSTPHYTRCDPLAASSNDGILSTVRGQIPVTLEALIDTIWWVLFRRCPGDVDHGTCSTLLVCLLLGFMLICAVV